MRKPAFISSGTLVLLLAFKELRHDWKATLVLLAVIVSIVAPLLILLGIKQGVVNTQTELLLNDPCNLEIKMLGHYNLPPTWFAEMEQDPRIQFVIPVTRFLNADINLIDANNNGESVDLIATGGGDPLLKKAGIEPPMVSNDVLVTYALAKRLQLHPGGQVRAQLLRTINGEVQARLLPLTIKAVIPDFSCLQRSAVLARPEFLVAVETFKEGVDVALPDAKHKDSKAPLKHLGAGHWGYSDDRGLCKAEDVAPFLVRPMGKDEGLCKGEDVLPFWARPTDDGFLTNSVDGLLLFPAIKEEPSIDVLPPPKKRQGYAKARIFAKQLDDVPIVVNELRGSKERMEITSKAAEIYKIKRLNHFLNLVMFIIAALSVTGGGVVLGGSFLLNIDRKRLHIAQLRLLGLGKRHIALFVWAQGMGVAGVAFIIAVLSSLLTQTVAEQLGKPILGEILGAAVAEVKVYELGWSEYFAAGGLTLAFSSLVVAVGTMRANKIYPGEGLREI